MRFWVALAFSVLFFNPAEAQPAGPDVSARPTPPPEAVHAEPARLVDPALTRATADMLAAYRTALAGVTGENQTDLADSQRLWVRYAAERCQIAQDLAPRTPHGAHRETLTQCLIRAAAERQAELRGALEAVGPWTFLRITDHRIRPSYADRGGGVVEESVTRLMIAKPVNEAERRWNAVVTRQFDQVMDMAYDLADGDPRTSTIELRDTSLKASVDLTAVTADLIDVAIHATADPSGAPPPQTSARHLIWSLRLDRAIDPTDLFDPKAPWRPSLAQMAVDRLNSAAPGGAPGPTLQAAMSLVGDSGRWALKPAGLAVDLRPNTAGATPAWALVPWPLLAPYLKRPPFLDPANLTEGPRL